MGVLRGLLTVCIIARLLQFVNNYFQIFSRKIKKTRAVQLWSFVSAPQVRGGVHRGLVAMTPIDFTVRPAEAGMEARIVRSPLPTRVAALSALYCADALLSRGQIFVMTRALEKPVLLPAIILRKSSLEKLDSRKISSGFMPNCLPISFTLLPSARSSATIFFIGSSW